MPSNRPKMQAQVLAPPSYSDLITVNLVQSIKFSIRLEHAVYFPKWIVPANALDCSSRIRIFNVALLMSLIVLISVMALMCMIPLGTAVYQKISHVVSVITQDPVPPVASRLLVLLLDRRELEPLQVE